ncbi:JNK-interacting protein 1 isoform X2 [Drosophila willistoni]|uniref:JNK-interacting protein 1 isoform X2 n=1 Tax=Drosophila willistoni TaxID=7260 RepID=UPI000C26D20F|nr:JNK-interacting protein 1 isoform X2 [Drosophila willistoni]
MADSEFEEFHRPIFEPHNLNTYGVGHISGVVGSGVGSSNKNKNNPHAFYSLIPNDDLDDSHSSKSEGEGSDQEDGILMPTESSTKNRRQVEDDELGDGLKVTLSSDGSLDTNSDSFNSHRQYPLNHQDAIGGFIGINGGSLAGNSISNTTTSTSTTNNTINTNTVVNTELLAPNSAAATRRRRKLPEIPKNKKCGGGGGSGSTQVGTLADEFRQATPRNSNHQQQQQQQQHRSFLSLKCGYLLDEDSSPDSERLQSLGDVDSGHSTAHSPNDFKSMSPQITSPVSQSPFPPPFGGVPFGQLEMLEATHRGLHKFVPRHHDEIELEIGDAIYVQKEAEDLWCEGVNLRTGRQGIFPSAYAVDLDYNEFDPTVQLVKKERYLLGYLGSVETLAHKGTGVVCQAVRKIVGEYGSSPTGQTCILEISDQGLRMVDRSTPNNKKEKKPCIDYFYSLKNVSFCAFHPRDHRFIGFITKHPTVQRFACHVFKGSESTRPVAEAVGRAFQRFYQKFIETAYPIEDIYIE